MVLLLRKTYIGGMNMLLKSLVVPKKNLTVVKESCTLEEAITILEE